MTEPKLPDEPTPMYTADRVCVNVFCRKGLRQMWDEFDKETRDDIKEDIAATIDVSEMQLRQQLTSALARVAEREGEIELSYAAHRLTVSHLSEANARAEAAEANDRLPADVVAMCKKRGWSMHWTHRGAYLHLESSELIEAIRGKHGDPALEAADVLLVLMSITEYAGIPWATVQSNARKKREDMMTRPHYKGEEFDAAIDAMVKS